MTDLTPEQTRGFGPIEGWKLHGCAGCTGVVYVPESHHPKTPAYCNVCKPKKEPPMAKKKKSSTKPKKKDFSAAIAASAEAQAGAAGAPEFTEIRRFKDRLKVKVSTEEHATLSAEFAHQYRLREAALEDRRNDMAKHKEKLTGIDQRMAELAESVEGHVKYQNIECIERLYPNNEVRIVRSDTNEVVETRTADAEDLQPELFDEGDAPAPKTGVCPHCSIVDGHRPDCPGPDTDDVDTEPPPPDGTDTGDLAAEQAEVAE